MVVKKKIIEAIAGKYYGGITDSRSTDDEENQSKSKTYTAGTIKKKTVFLKGEKDDFIYNYNLRLHGGRGDKTPDITLTEDSEWVEKV